MFALELFLTTSFHGLLGMCIIIVLMLELHSLSFVGCRWEVMSGGVCSFQIKISNEDQVREVVTDPKIRGY